MITYKEETYTPELEEELLPHFKVHSEEVKIFSHSLDVNSLAYLKASMIGSFRIYVARKDGEVIGYAAYWIDRHPHYSLQTANQDALYVKKENRKGRIGINLIKYSEEELKKLGVDLIIQHTKCHKDFGTLLEWMGYKESDRIFIKEV